MIELEILFSSGQGIVVQLEDREAALRFMQRAMDHNLELESGLFHLSTAHEEILIDLGDISFIRLKKENYPRLGATLKLPEQTSFHDRVPDSQVEDKVFEESAKAPAPEQGERHFTVDPQGNIAEDPVAKKFERAEARLKQAEARLEQVEVQKRKVEDQLRKTAEEFEDAAKEVELRQKIEGIEIDGEIERMKARSDD